MTAEDRLNQQINIADILSANEPVCYFEAGSGADWLLAIAQGLQAVGTYALLVGVRT